MRTLPYNLTEEEILAEPSSVERMLQDRLPTLFMMCVEVQNKLDVKDRRRVWDAALALYPRLLEDPEFSVFDRIELFRIAFDTAMVWEFG